MLVNFLNRFVSVQRLNELVDRDTEFHLHVTSSRYGDGFVAFLAEGDESSHRMASNCTDSDMEHHDLMQYFNNNDWYPFVTANSFAEALEKLVERINSISKDDYHVWIKAVALASNHFLCLRSPAREKQLPNFAEYVGNKREQTYAL